MRKALFAIVLIGAAFAGGAAVNGPGLRWAQATILKRMRAEEEPAPDELAPPQAGDPTVGGVPSAPVAPLVVEAAKPVPAPDKDKAAKSAPAPGPGSEKPPGLEHHEAAPVPRAEAPAELPAPAPQPVPEPDPRAAQAPAELPPVAPRPEPLPPLEPPTASGPPASTPAGARDPARQGEDQNRPWGDLPDSAPAAAVPPRPRQGQTQTPSPTPSPILAERNPAVGWASLPAESPGAPAAPAAGATSPSPSGDWSEVRRKMRALGVSRYGFEGEPGGRVRFHCVIPLAGRRAVGQQFEAEGDDEFQAAQTALRRVALWRATEHPAR